MNDVVSNSTLNIFEPNSLIFLITCTYILITVD